MDTDYSDLTEKHWGESVGYTAEDTAVLTLGSA